MGMNLTNQQMFMPEEGIDPEWSPQTLSMETVLILARELRFFFTYATKQKDYLT